MKSVVIDCFMSLCFVLQPFHGVLLSFVISAFACNTDDQDTQTLTAAGLSAAGLEARPGLKNANETLDQIQKSLEVPRG